MKKSNVLTAETMTESCYLWRGKDKMGHSCEGQIYAISKVMARALLIQKGNTPEKIWKRPQSILDRYTTIRSTDIAIFSRQLATMLKAGVPLVQSFDIVSATLENQKMREIVKKIHFDVASGSGLATSLARHPKYFDSLYCNLVSSGESSGTLETMLDRIATHKEKSEKLKNKIKKALTYPSAVMLIAIVVTAILLVKVVPQFASTFKNFGAELPLYTRLVLDLSKFAQEWWLILLTGFPILVSIFITMRERSLSFSKLIDKLILKLPIVGNIIHDSVIARFSRTLATTCSAGVPLVNALDSTVGTAGNHLFSTAISRTREFVTAGATLSQSLKLTNCFPTILVQMVAIGEESGTLDEMLEKVAIHYEEAVDDAVENLSALLEPVIMAILGVLIGGLMVAMYLPIFLLGSVI